MKNKTYARAALLAAFLGLGSFAQAAAPQITSILTPGGATPQSNVTVSADATDEDGDLVAIYITITGPTGYNSTGGNGASGYSGTGWASIYTAYSGSYVVEVVAVDAEGNRTTEWSSFDAEWWWG